MIAYLSGKIISKQERSLIIDVNGVGYLVNAPRSFLEKVIIGEERALNIHTQVREDDISLYGFPSETEWHFFRLLITVSGVGPKSALEILNAPIEGVKQAIAKKDTAFLVQIPGIGRKTAERIIVDLQGKIEMDILESAIENQPKNHEDIVQALMSLGYNRQHVMNVLKKLPSDIVGEEAVIKFFLQNN